MIDTHACFQFEEVQGQPDYVTATWIVPQDLPYLQGHFPGQPIVPAVAILDATNELLNRALRQNLELTQLKNAKFTKPLEPTQAVSIECMRVVDNEWTVDWSIQGELVARLLIVT